MQIRIGKKFGFVAALVVAVFASQSALAGDLNGANKTITKEDTTSYSNSSATLSTVTLQHKNSTWGYKGKLSGNIKLVVDNTSCTDASKSQQMSQLAHSHTGGTLIKAVTTLTASGDYTIGTQPIELVANATPAKNGCIAFNNKSSSLSNDINITCDSNPGYQSTCANIHIRNAASGGDGAFNGKITALDCEGVAFHQGAQCTYSQARKMNFNGEIDATGSDVYLTAVSNSVVNFNNDFTAKRLLCAYYTAASRLCRVNFKAGKNFSFDSIELAGHFLNVNGVLNEGCVLAFTATSAGSVDDAICTAKYGNTGTKPFPDPEISKITFGADQTINCVTGPELTQEQAAEPGMVLKGDEKTLTLKCAQSLAQCTAKVSGSLSLVLDATDKANTQEFLSRENDTLGTIRVKKGVFKIGKDASFPYVTDVTVDADGTLEIGDTVVNPFGADTSLVLNLAAKECLDVSASASLTVRQMFIDGVKISQSQIPTLFPDAGTITITDAAAKLTEATWCGQGSDRLVTTKENWENCESGVESENYQLAATFATGGTEASIPADFTFKGLTFDLDNDFAFSGETVDLGADGISFPSTDEKRTVTFNAPVNIAAAQTWTIGGPNSVIDLKSGLSGSAALTINSETANTPLTLGFGTKNTYAGTLTTANAYLNFVSPGATLCGPVAIGKVKPSGSFKAFAVAEGTDNEFKGAVTVTGNGDSMQVSFGAGSSTKFGGKYTCASTTTTWTLGDQATVEFAGGVAMSGGMTLKQGENATGKLIVSGAPAKAYKWQLEISEVELGVDDALAMNNTSAAGVDVSLRNTDVNIGSTLQKMCSLKGSGSITGGSGSVVTASRQGGNVALISHGIVFKGEVSLSYSLGTNTLTSVSTSTGVLKTKTGGTVLTLAPGSYWAGVKVVVENDSTLVLNPKTIAKTAALEVAAGGKVVLADGRVKVASLKIGETEYERGIYYVKELFGEDAGEGRIWVGDIGGALIIR